jgi:phenylacetate-coenzyme A ligase PaaK-like adenylate-forming protein
MSFFSLLNQFNARNDLLITPNELKRRHIRDARRCFKEKKSALFYSKEQLQELRNQRLSALLLYAKYHSPWYKKTLAKINLKNFTVARLHELPIINKTILMDHWDEIVTNRKLSLALVENHLRRKNHEINTLS